MEDIEYEETAFTIEESNDDFCNSILSRFGKSSDESNQHLCTVIGAMSQEFKDKNLPSSPVAYFAATCSSLDRIASELDPANHLIDALLTILSMVIVRVPVAVLRNKKDYLSELIVKILRSPSATESAVIHGLKCLSHSLINRGSVNWSEVSPLFNVLLGFLTDSRPKVRRQSHLCLRDVMSNFQNSPVLVPLSEGVKNLFERCLLLADPANANAGDATKGAQQVLYILDALKECLHFLSSKYKTNVLKYFKSLLDMRQPLVTRRITDSLNLLCLYPTSEFSPDALLELLTSLALSISSNEMSGDGMTFTARLLDAGMNKVYSLNRQICVSKLPTVFNALKDILTSEHEEAIYAATNALKNMINSCIDESLIKQGVDMITLEENKKSRKSGPTIIEKLCSTIESLLDYHYAAVWDRVFEVVSSMFHKLGSHSSYLMQGILQNLEDVQKLPDEDFPFRKQLQVCIGSAVVAMGPETLLSLIPLNVEAEDLSEANIWLFPILKQYIVGAHLKYFMKVILPMIKRVKEKAHKLEKQGMMVSSRNADNLAFSLWSLLPSFCNYPLDTAQSFMDLEKHLCNKLKEEHDIRGIICTSLQILIQQNKNIKDSNNSEGILQHTAKEEVLVHYSPQVATGNLIALASSAKKLLEVLSEVFLMTSKDDGGCLQRTIGDIASIAKEKDEKDVHNLFIKKMQLLCKCTLKANKLDNSKNFMQIDDASNNVSPPVFRARLLDFAASLLPGLGLEHIDVLFQALKPALQDSEGVVQKKAYKVLSLILKSSDSFVSSKFDELRVLVTEILPSYHLSAKRHRLDCLYFLIVHGSKSKDNLAPWPENFDSLLTEIILALKEPNRKTRNRAYDILVEIAHAFGDEEKGGNRESLFKFFKEVAGRLRGETPHMKSAAVKGLARLAYEFSDLVLRAFEWLPVTFHPLMGENREIIKANLGFLKVLVAKSQAEGLQMHLKNMVDCLLMWQDNTKNHFKAKVKLLLGMLVTKCGFEAVKAVMPDDHMKLLTNIRKIKERKERNQGAKSEETRSHLSKATTSRHSMWNHTKIFSDFGGDSTNSDAEYLNANTISRGRKSSLHHKSAASSFRSNIRLKKNLPEHLTHESDDEPLDLLDQHKTRSALRSSEHLKRKSTLDDEVEVDSEGRMIIREEGDKRKEKPTDPDLDIRSERDSHMTARSGTKAQKRRKTSDSGWAYTGKEYASKKAGGDLKRKDKLEPYAYWPLDRKMISRRPQQRAAARKGLASVVKMTKKLEGKSASSALSVKRFKPKRTQKKGSK